MACNMSSGIFLATIVLLAYEVSQYAESSRVREAGNSHLRVTRETCDTATHFLYTRNDTCIECGEPCKSCVPYTNQLEYACAACKLGYTFSLQPEVTWGAGSDPLGGSCVRECQGIGRLTAEDSSRILLNKPQESPTSGEHEGRVEVYYNSQWWTVCDDHWTMANTDVVCKEMGLGRGLEFFQGYDLLYPELQPLNIGFDDVHCEAGEQSFFQCTQNDFGIHDCLGSETIGVRCSGPEHSPHCVKECYLGQYVIQSTGSICKECLPRCLACEGKADLCTLCEQPGYLTVDGSCTTQCAPGFYGNRDTFTCAACHPNCSTCENSADKCQACNNHLVLHGVTCVETCPVGTFLLESEIPKCVDDCPDGYYASRVSNKCLQCHESCQTCSHLSTNCTSCTEPKLLQSNELPSDLFSGRCEDHCSQGFYPNAQRECTPCIDPNCQQCYLGGLLCSKCRSDFKLQLLKCVTSCDRGLFDVSGICQDACHPGFYGDENTGKCEMCAPRCYKCRRDDPSICMSCLNSFYLKDGACVTDCGEEMVAVSQSASSDVRLLGGSSSLDGRVEVFYRDRWGQVCADGWTMIEAQVVCKQLGLGHAIQMSTDDRYGSSSLALGRRVKCTGQETTIWDCQREVPTQSPDCQGQIAGVRCSGPDSSHNRLCVVRNPDACDATTTGPCHVGVTCTDLSLGSGSYCGECPPGMAGDGKQCEEMSSNPTGILFPSEQLTVISNWPEGTELTLPCVGYNENTLVTSWQHDDVDMTLAGATHRISGSGSLTLFSPTMTAAPAIYTCTVANLTDSVSISYELSFQRGVKITDPPKNYTGSGKILLSCGFDGTPTPTVTWYKDGNTIDNDDFIRQSDYGLVIQEALSIFSGTYRCEVENLFTSDHAEATVFIKGPAKIISRTDTDFVAALGQNFSVTCIAAGGPNPTITWKRDKDTVLDSDHIKVALDGTMYITQVLKTDAGEYTCTAKNEEGPMDTWTITIVVWEQPLARITPPSVVVSLGQTASFACSVEGDQPLDITWFIPNRGNFTASNDTLMVQINNEYLNIMNVTESNAGEVNCIATNAAGSAMSFASLAVRVPPRFVDNPGNVTALSGWPLCLSVVVYSVPESQITWYRGGALIFNSNDGIHNISTQGNSSTLSFMPKLPDIPALFTVKAMNTEGTSSLDIFVKVLRLYDAPLVLKARLTNATVAFTKDIDIETQSNLLYEVWVGKAGKNETRSSITTNPLDLPMNAYNKTAMVNNPNYGYISLVFNKLPKEAFIGDGSTATLLKDAFYNAPLLPGQWYAVCLRISRYTVGLGEVLRTPLGATEYQYIYTKQAPTNDDSSDTAVIVTVIVMSFIILAGTIIFVLYKKHLLRIPSLPHWFRQSGSMMDMDGQPIDVEGFLEQFSTEATRVNYAKIWASTSSRTTSTSTLYIPTEDEIEKLDKLGIDYYLDDEWLQKIPTGVLEIDDDALQNLKKKDRDIEQADQPSTSTSKSSSDPKMAATSSPEMSSNGVKESQETSTREERTKDDKEDISTEDIVEEAEAPQTSSVSKTEHRELDQSTSALSKESIRQSDSGFESEQFQLQRKLSLPPKSVAPALADIVSVMRSHSNLTQASKDTFNSFSSSSEEKKKYKPPKSKEKHKRGRGRKISKFRERGAEIISNLSRKMSMHVFDLDHGPGHTSHDDDEENYAADGSGESDVDDHFKSRKAPPNVQVRPRPVMEDEELDLENAYIDPSSIVSVPKATNRLKELKQHNQVHSRLEESAPKLFHMTQAIIHHGDRRLSLAYAADKDSGGRTDLSCPSVFKENPMSPDHDGKDKCKEQCGDREPKSVEKKCASSDGEISHGTEVREGSSNSNDRERKVGEERSQSISNTPQKHSTSKTDLVGDDLNDSSAVSLDNPDHDENKKKDCPAKRENLERTPESTSSPRCIKVANPAGDEAKYNDEDGDHIYLSLINLAPAERVCPACKIVHGETLQAEGEKGRLDTPPVVPPRPTSLPPSPVRSPKRKPRELGRRFSFPAHRAGSSRRGSTKPIEESLGEEIRRFSMEVRRESLLKEEKEEKDDFLSACGDANKTSSMSTQQAVQSSAGQSFSVDPMPPSSHTLTKKESKRGSRKLLSRHSMDDGSLGFVSTEDTIRTANPKLVEQLPDSPKPKGKEMLPNPSDKIASTNSGTLFTDSKARSPSAHRSQETSLFSSSSSSAGSTPVNVVKSKTKSTKTQSLKRNLPSQDPEPPPLPPRNKRITTTEKPMVPHARRKSIVHPTIDAEEISALQEMEDVIVAMEKQEFGLLVEETHSPNITEVKVDEKTVYANFERNQHTFQNADSPVEGNIEPSTVTSMQQEQAGSTRARNDEHQGTLHDGSTEGKVLSSSHPPEEPEFVEGADNKPIKHTDIDGNPSETIPKPAAITNQNTQPRSKIGLNEANVKAKDNVDPKKGVIEGQTVNTRRKSTMETTDNSSQLVSSNVTRPNKEKVAVDPKKSIFKEQSGKGQEGSPVQSIGTVSQSVSSKKPLAQNLPGTKAQANGRIETKPTSSSNETRKQSNSKSGSASVVQNSHSDSRRNSSRKTMPVIHAASSKPRPRKLVIPGVFGD